MVIITQTLINANAFELHRPKLLATNEKTHASFRIAPNTYMVKNIVNNILKKITDKFSVKKEKFGVTTGGDNEKGKFNPLILISVCLIVSFVLDILKFTPVYDNNIMKHVLNTNYWLSYGMTSLGKLIGFVLFAFMGLPGIFDDLKEEVILAKAETEYSTGKYKI